MMPMSTYDHLDLDGHLLTLLLAVYDEQSVTRAAQRLGVTQSAVSHGLDKLRAITGDALFVRAGRGITATSQAALLAGRARELLAGLQGFSTAAAFAPERLDLCLTLAANDLQRDLLLPALLRRLRAQAPGVVLRIVPSGAPEPALLREGSCQLLITPRPPNAADIVQKRLFDDRYVVFYDAGERAAPTCREHYLAGEHLSVSYEMGSTLDIDQWLLAEGVQRHVVATVPGLAALGAMLRGSTWLATAPSLLARQSLAGLATAPLPLATPRLAMYMVWHERVRHDPAHRWLRGELEAVAREVQATSSVSTSVRACAA